MYEYQYVSEVHVLNVGVSDPSACMGGTDAKTMCVPRRTERQAVAVAALHPGAHRLAEIHREAPPTSLARDVPRATTYIASRV